MCLITLRYSIRVILVTLVFRQLYVSFLTLLTPLVPCEVTPS